MKLFFSAIAAYLIGSIPTGWIFGKVFKGVDIREYGSGNIGATNVVRIVGRVPGALVLLIDIAKGFLCTFYLAGDDTSKIIVGTSVILGHIWTIFLHFKGGKGVATSAGVLLALMPDIVAVAFVIWFLVALATRFVSLASIVAAISIPIILVVLARPIPVILFSTFISLFVLYKHLPNIRRLLAGEERRLGEKLKVGA